MDEVTWLCSAPGAEAIAAAALAVVEHPGDPLAASTALRRAQPALTPAQVATALDQVSLRRLATERHGIDASGLLLTRDGLEQATRPAVAALRARALREAGARRVVDLTAGLGLDDRAFADAGLDVVAIERDPLTAALLRHNLPGADVIVGDATDEDVLARVLADLGPEDVVFVDPARRTPGGARDLASGRARPERDPELWSPPWSFVARLPHPRVAAKAAPGFSPPVDWHAQWTSVDRVVVECAVFSWPVFGAPRRAAILSSSGTTILDAVDDPLPLADDIGGWLLEPDPAVLASAVQGALRRYQPDVARVDAQSTWLTCVDSPANGLASVVRAYRVDAVLSGSAKQQRVELRKRGIDRLVIKSRDVRTDPTRALRDLGCSEGGPHTLVLTTRAERAISVLVDPVPLPQR